MKKTSKKLIQNKPIHLIYVLKDPRDGRIFYVGRTERRLRTRLAEHIRLSRRYPNSCKSRRIKEILKADRLPLIKQIDRAHSLEDAIAREAKHIYKHKRIGKIDNKASARAGGRSNEQKIKDKAKQRKREQVSIDKFQINIRKCPLCSSIAVIQTDDGYFCRRCERIVSA